MSKETMITRNSIKLLLFNSKNELLLQQCDDPKTTSSDGKYHGTFWTTIGGKIEAGETPQEAAIRELHEETGMSTDDVTFGPVVWFGECELILSGKPTLLKQQFIIAHTKNNSISLEHMTEDEKRVVQKCSWFSLKDILNCPQVIYPVGIEDYLPDIIAGKYPNKPIEIDLGKKP